MKCVFRYSGGKSRMLKILTPYLTALVDGEKGHGDPFTGGGSPILHIAAKNPKLELFINDKDDMVSSFWRIVCDPSPDKSLDLIRRLHIEPTIEVWTAVKTSTPKTDVAKAFKAVFLNRTSFNGMIYHSSPIGGMEQKGKPGAARMWTIGCQYKPDTLGELIMHYRTLLAGRTTVTCMDGADFMKMHPEIPHFIDPPYFVEETGNKLYGIFMTMADHQRLAAQLKESRKWVLTYDFSSEVAKNLYYGALMHVVPVHYSSTTSASHTWKKDAEIIAFKGIKVTT